MRKQISFLLGAGFSTDAGYPLAKQLSEKVELAINSFKDKNFVRFKKERITFAFYNSIKEVSPTWQFNYEEFFDFINFQFKALLPKGSEKDIQNFKQIVLQKVEDNGVDNALSDPMRLRQIIRDKYTELICEKLTSNNAILSSAYYGFFDFTTQMADNEFLIKIHTLNHDTLLENLFTKNHIRYADGYTTNDNDPHPLMFYKGTRYSDCKRAAIFRDLFDSSICLYKLHGSLDRFRVELNNPDNQYDADFESVKTNDCNQYLRDYNYFRRTNSGIKRLFEFINPDLLTGSNTKQNYYDVPPYKELFEHFEENIKCADILIIIGYSFCDDRINDIIKKLPQKNIVITACKGSNMKAKKIFPKHDIWEFEDLIGIDFSAIKSKLS